jgi:DNA-binding CsgD family transcriptional regulator
VHIKEEDYLAHYGTLRRSGRYEWGSGGNESGSAPRNMTFLDTVTDLKRRGLTEVEIAKGLGLSTTELRARRTIARNEAKQAEIAFANRLKAKQMSNVAIGERMGRNESYVRSLLAENAQEKADILLNTANVLQKRVDEVGFLDIGSGVEHHLDVSSTKLAASVAILKEKGYRVHSVKITQLGTGLETEMKVLTKPGTTQKEAWLNRDNIRQIQTFSEDGGRSHFGLLPHISINPKRIAVRYKEEGGDEADGVIYVRPGVKDVSLGNSRYAQVRVAVGKGHYLKGMAMYKDDLPDGVDLMFNTNKSDTGNKLDALKPMTEDMDNPFGAVFKRQITELKPDGTRKVTSAMNLVNEEGDWLKWSRSIAPQVLSKQSPSLARTQLDITYTSRKDELEEILALTNPTVRKKMLKDFSDATDAAAVHLKAAALPRQGWHTILPMSSMKPTEIYAPNFNDGERVALIRYPHGGTFEIPELVVNNNNRGAKRLLGNARDAVGIHSSVAERLSGADFDGDTVLVIPNNAGKIKSTPALEKLKGFDPRTEYKAYEGMKVMDGPTKQREMGNISNLITDMTIHGASTQELAQAIRHSMVVIDAENHKLDYKRSAVDNGIAKLKEKYQGKTTAGASTLISRAGAKVMVPDRKLRLASEGGPIDPVTGRKVFVETGKINFRTGGPKLTRSKKLAEEEDAHVLSSGTPIERLYADHSNRLKDMGNQARLAMINTPALKYSASAKKAYANEVASLNASLNLAIRNRPLERQAQVFANAIIKAKRAANPGMDEASFKKMKFQALEEARNRTGARKAKIVISPSEWDAIQAGAIMDTKLSTILDNADIDVVRQLATPRREIKMTPTKLSRAQAMLDSGYTRAEVAAQLGVSLTTLDTATNE